MARLSDRPPAIASPALVPAQAVFEDRGCDRPALTIGLINNMPDAALKATERQFSRLIEAATGDTPVRFHCFTLPSIRRSAPAQWHVDQSYDDIADLPRLRLDGLIVTGAEPMTRTLPQESYWRELTGLIDWAAINTRSTIWSCLAAHAAVLHLDGIERQRLPRKCSGVYDCVKMGDDWLTRDAPSPLRVPHSRLNELREDDLTACGYQILTRSEEAGVDIFCRQGQSRFIFFQGHPEYDAHSLQREYMRDIARFLSGERDDYPNMPAGYFDAETEQILARFERRAKAEREPTLAADLPGLALRGGIEAGTAAAGVFRNWIGFLAESARTTLPVR